MWHPRLDRDAGHTMAPRRVAGDSRGITCHRRAPRSAVRTGLDAAPPRAQLACASRIPDSLA